LRPSTVFCLPLAFEPGTQRSYSNGGYAVLARVMEMVRGRPYAELMRDLVFAPLGMHRSGAIADPRLAPEGWAKGHAPGTEIGTRQPARFYAAETRPGGGSLHASAEDVLLFFGAAWRRTLPGTAEFPALFGGDRPGSAPTGGRRASIWTSIMSGKRT
jgi:CubicO group peptidase (beta-lactamase class C family)